MICCAIFGLELDGAEWNGNIVGHTSPPDGMCREKGKPKTHSKAPDRTSSKKISPNLGLEHFSFGVPTIQFWFIAIFIQTYCMCQNACYRKCGRNLFAIVLRSRVFVLLLLVRRVLVFPLRSTLLWRVYSTILPYRTPIIFRIVCRLCRRARLLQCTRSQCVPIASRTQHTSTPIYEVA